MASLKWLPSFIFLVGLTNLFAITKSQFPTPIYYHLNCLNNGTYTSNSTYRRNLHTILSSVSGNIDANGFYNASIGENPDRVNVIALCRADLQPDQCRTYIENATATIVQKCRGQRQAILWHEFCMVRYADEPILGNVSFSPSDHGRNVENITNPDVFYSELTVLLDSLRDYAAFNSSPKKFAGSSRDVPNYRTVYAFEQCTPDITPNECRDCLTRSAQQISECCDMARGVRILLPSCYLRFETDPDPFYNVSMVVPISQPPTPPLPPPHFPPPPQSPPSPGDDKNTSRTIVIIVVPIVGCLLLVLCIGIYLKMKNMQKLKEDLELEDGISTVESLQYDFDMIRAATDDFANKLGQGGFGPVYKGKLPNGNEIAVKRLSMSSEQGDLEFKNEVVLLARLQHRNLVRLLGFSVEGNERLLIYEWVQNGSLHGFIFDPNSARIDWEKRYRIIVGVAKGLLYLHEDSRLQIIHRDLKPDNILLDGEMNPKISDFGMARLFVPNETDQHSTSRVVGTYGYIAPEYAIHWQCSTKSDVFSFGTLVLEIITGQETRNFQQEGSTDLRTSVWENWHQQTILNIIDPGLRTASGSMHDIKRCIQIGLLCVQHNATDRPTMGSVVLMISSNSYTMPIPSKPVFFTSSSFRPEISDNDTNTLSVANSNSARLVSSNEVTMSEIDLR